MDSFPTISRSLLLKSSPSKMLVGFLATSPKMSILTVHNFKGYRRGALGKNGLMGVEMIRKCFWKNFGLLGILLFGYVVVSLIKLEFSYTRSLSTQFDGFPSRTS